MRADGRRLRAESTAALPHVGSPEALRTLRSAMPQFADPFARPSIAHLSLGRTSGELDLARHLEQLDDGRPHPFCRRCLDGPFGIVVLVAADELDARPRGGGSASPREPASASSFSAGAAASSAAPTGRSPTSSDPATSTPRAAASI